MIGALPLYSKQLAVKWLVLRCVQSCATRFSVLQGEGVCGKCKTGLTCDLTSFKLLSCSSILFPPPRLRYIHAHHPASGSPIRDMCLAFSWVTAR